MNLKIPFNLFIFLACLATSVSAFSAEARRASCFLLLAEAKVDLNRALQKMETLEAELKRISGDRSDTDESFLTNPPGHRLPSENYVDWMNRHLALRHWTVKDLQTRGIGAITLKKINAVLAGELPKSTISDSTYDSRIKRRFEEEPPPSWLYPDLALLASRPIDLLSFYDGIHWATIEGLREELDIYYFGDLQKYSEDKIKAVIKAKFERRIDIGQGDTKMILKLRSKFLD